MRTSHFCVFEIVKLLSLIYQLNFLQLLYLYSAQKGNFLGPAAKEGIAILFPDTSPRGAGIEGETDSWDFGVGASFRLSLYA